MYIHPNIVKNIKSLSLNKRGMSMRYLKVPLIIILLCVLAAGCSPARKPEVNNPPRTVVEPQVSQITYEVADLNHTPPVVQQMAKEQAGNYFGQWTAVNGTNYVLISQAALPVNYRLVLVDIERHIPATNFTWVNVRLKSVPVTQGYNAAGSSQPLVVTFKGDRGINGISFTYINNQEHNQSQNQTARPPANISRKVTQSKIPAGQADKSAADNKPKEVSQDENKLKQNIKVSQPTAGQTIGSPVRVAGTAQTFQGAIWVRLRSSSGLVLSEKPALASASGSAGGTFEASLSFTAPKSTTRGTVEVFSNDPRDGHEKDLVSVPVSISADTSGSQ